MCSSDLQLPTAADDRFAGLQWRFVRIKYHFTTEGTRQGQDFYGEPWLIDGPAAEQNLSRRIKTATAIDVLDPIVLTLDDPRVRVHIEDGRHYLDGREELYDLITGEPDRIRTDTE